MPVTLAMGIAYYVFFMPMVIATRMRMPTVMGMPMTMCTGTYTIGKHASGSVCWQLILLGTTLGLKNCLLGLFKTAGGCASTRWGERGEREIRAAAVLELYRPAGCRVSPHHHFDKM